MSTKFVTILGLLLVTMASFAQTVGNVAELRSALSGAKPGARILLKPGNYQGGISFPNLKGETNRPIVIGAVDPANPPLIEGGGSGLHLQKPAWVELHNLSFQGARGNGLSIDDGGNHETPAHHIVMRGIKIINAGSTGNHDGIKLSGISDFVMEGCTVERWGLRGSAVDMVGCHRGILQSNLFRHTDTNGVTEANGVQTKGGSSDIVVRHNRFENAGSRSINIGGSTGRQFFRPPLKGDSGHFEARNIQVENNTIEGGGAAMAFVGVDGAMVRSNVITRPHRYVLRILQENGTAGFIPSRNGRFIDNTITFNSRELGGGAVNVGGKTEPESFVFERNQWYCIDNPARSKPSLPVKEKDGIYGILPK